MQIDAQRKRQGGRLRVSISMRSQEQLLLRFPLEISEESQALFAPAPFQMGDPTHNIGVPELRAGPRLSRHRGRRAGETLERLGGLRAVAHLFGFSFVTPGCFFGGSIDAQIRCLFLELQNGEKLS